MRLLRIILMVSAIAGLNSAAANEREKIEAPFSYSKEQLLTKAGAKAVLSDLFRFAQKSCRVAFTDERLIVRQHDPDCVAEFVSDAVAKINMEKLTEAFGAKTR